MSKLDEIKERLLDYKANHTNTGASMDAEYEFETNAKNDIEYLLSCLEIAEKALEWYGDNGNFTKQEGLIPNTTIITSNITLDQGVRAREVLQQLRS